MLDHFFCFATCRELQWADQQVVVEWLIRQAAGRRFLHEFNYADRDGQSIWIMDALVERNK